MSRRVKTLIAITTTTIEKKKEEGEEENLIVSTCQVLFSFFLSFKIFKFSYANQIKSRE